MTLRARSISAWAAILLLSLPVFIVCTPRTINPYDEGIVLTGAANVLHGAMPHRDFYTNYGPAQFVAVAGLFKLFGASVLMERVWDAAARSVIVSLVYLLGRRVTTPALALAAAIGSLVWLISDGLGYGYPLFPCIAATLAGMIFVLRAVEGKARDALASGILFGVAALFRYDVGVADLCAGCVAVGAGTWRMRPNPQRVIVLNNIALISGFASVAAPVAIVFAAAGALPDLVFDIVTFAAGSYARTRTLPFPGLADCLAQPLRLGIYLPMAVCLCAIPAIARAPGHAGEPAVNRRGAQALCLALFTLVGAAKGWVRASPLHMSMALILSLPLLALLAGAYMRRGPGIGGPSPTLRTLLARAGTRREHAPVLICAVCATILTGFGLREGVRRATETIAWAADPAAWRQPASWPPPPEGTCRMPAGLERLACFRLDPSTADTIRYVQEHTRPGDPVFVGLPRHDRIFANDVALYFQIDRPPATKWYHFDPGLQTSTPIQAEMVAELRRTRPKLIVIADVWQNFNERNDSARSSGITILDRYLHAAFVPVATFGRNSVLRAVGP